MGLVTKEEYQGYIEGLIRVLKGRDQSVLESLRERMGELAAEMRYEEAATYRDRIAALTHVMETRTPTQQVDQADRDILGTYRAGEELQIHVLFYRGGKLLDAASHLFKSPLPDALVLRQFVMRFYTSSRVQVPPEIVVSLPLDDAEGLSVCTSGTARGTPWRSSTRRGGGSAS